MRKRSNLRWQVWQAKFEMLTLFVLTVVRYWCHKFVKNVWTIFLRHFQIIISTVVSLNKIYTKYKVKMGSISNWTSSWSTSGQGCNKAKDSDWIQERSAIRKNWQWKSLPSVSLLLGNAGTTVSFLTARRFLPQQRPSLLIGSSFKSWWLWLQKEIYV